MVTCPKCGRPMQRWPQGWFACRKCGLAGHLDWLEWLRKVILQAGEMSERRAVFDGTLSQV